jgi:nitrite reductase/ring-hydroxylating ferredoxin subunit
VTGAYWLDLTAGHAYAVCNDAGRFAVVDNACPHVGGSLGRASVRAGRIICPWHLYEWDLATGRSPDFPRTLRVYPTRVRNGRVEIRTDV